MKIQTESWGAKAQVYLKFDGGINELSTSMSKGLLITQWSFDNDSDPPYERFAMFEVLGFEITIRPSTLNEKFRHEIEIITENCHDEIMRGRMHNISLWFGRYISLMCDIECMVYDEITLSNIVFSKGEVM